MQFIELMEIYEKRAEIMNKIVSESESLIQRLLPRAKTAFKKTLELELKQETANFQSQQEGRSQAEAKSLAKNEIMRKFTDMEERFEKDYPGLKLQVVDLSSLKEGFNTQQNNSESVSDCEKSEVIRISNRIHQKIVEIGKKTQQLEPISMELFIIISFYILDITEKAAKTSTESVEPIQQIGSMSESELESDVNRRTEENRATAGTAANNEPEGFIDANQNSLGSAISDGVGIAQQTTSNIIEKTCAQKLAEANQKPIPQEIIDNNLKNIENIAPFIKKRLEFSEKQLEKYDQLIKKIEGSGRAVDNVAQSAGFGAIQNSTTE